MAFYGRSNRTGHVMPVNRLQNTRVAPMIFVAAGSFAMPVLAQPSTSSAGAQSASAAATTTATPKAPIVPQPVTPPAPSKSDPPVVPQSQAPIDVEQVKPEKDVTLKPTPPNNPRPKITTRDGLAAEQ